MIKPRTTNNQRQRPREDILISIIIAIYNGEKYLSQTLDSVAGQNGLMQQGRKNNGMEVILIDDFSTDTSANIIRHYIPLLEQMGFSVRYITHQQNAGTLPSYTEGALLARGKYFKILDHDDLLASTNALAEPVQCMESMESRGCRIGAVFSKSLYIDVNNLVFGEKRFPFPFLPYEARNGCIPKKWGRFVLAVSPFYPFVHGASVVRKTCWQDLSAGQLSQQNIGLFDVAFAIRLMHSNVWEMAYLRAPALRYRIHAANFTQGMIDRKDWTEILNGYYDDVYPKSFRLTLIKQWNWYVQWLKSAYHKRKGPNAFKSIKLFR
jgi:glycosyltransferase involved in cell wall biosynthesis